jgi:uncharacterized membrane protein
VKGLLALLAPVKAPLPATTELRQVVGILPVLMVCFLVGLAVRTGPGPRAKTALGRHRAERIPGFVLIRGLAARLAGQGEDETFAVALVEIDDGLVPAFVVEEHEDGAYTIFVASVPIPATGAIDILPRERVHLVDVSFTKAARVIAKWGTGAKELREAMLAQEGSRP